MAASPKGEEPWEQPALQILRENWGPLTSIDAEEPLGGSDRSNVRRVTLRDGNAGAPETVVVKQAGARGDVLYDPIVWMDPPTVC